MYVVLCENYKEAAAIFSIFLDMLEQEEEDWYLSSVLEHSLTISTPDHLGYIFIDYHYMNVFNPEEYEFLDVHDFVEHLFT